MVVLTGLVLFLIATLGIIINRLNLILILMSLEIMLLSICILLIWVSSFYGVVSGYLFTLIVLTVAACESAIGLTMMISYYRITGHISIKLLNLLRG
uniref:NADH-ubiquinone oxidoreductase chain 4L n=1 Tax=Carybdea xaymacana TaxID=168719 RepID=G9IT68_9CNID|nr:NADH dehydrogenase subunit 4L [Carybdea xaymacana]